MAASDYFVGANFAFMMYPGLTHGAGKLVETFLLNIGFFRIRKSAFNFE